MKIFKFIALVILWSGVALSKTEIPAAIRILGPEFKDVPESKIEVKNMPRVKSQDSLGICYACGAATIAQKFYCDEEKVSDCKSVSPDKDISMLSMVSWAKPDSKTIPEDSRYSPYVHTNLSLQTGGSGYLALLYSKQAYEFTTESCYPFDQLANKYGSDKEVQLNEKIEKIKSIYDKNKKTQTEAGGECLTCLSDMANEINSTLLIKISATDLSSILKENKTFEQFLYQAFFKNCATEPLLINPLDVGFYPKPNEPGTPEKLIETAKAVLKKGRPLLLEGICLARNSQNGSCNSTHTFVVKGYKKACAPSGACRELFNVQNCWGEDWQKQVNDGWLDADSLIQNIEGSTESTGKGQIYDNSKTGAVLSWLVY